jgi:DNA-binding response OmpR family regulator
VKNILIASEINWILQKKNSFLQRADMRVFTAATSDEALAIHRSEHLDLIITQLDLPGMPSERFCSLIREDQALRNVVIIMVCANDQAARARSLRLGVQAVYRMPVKPALVLAKARTLLNLSLRETYRVLLSVAVEGNASDQLFSCRTLDISTTGMLLETTLTFRQNDRLFCSFHLPDADTTHIMATGEVVRTIQYTPGTDANRYGIHFLDLSAEAQKALQAFLATGSPQQVRASSTPKKRVNKNSR